MKVVRPVSRAVRPAELGIAAAGAAAGTGIGWTVGAVGAIAGFFGGAFLGLLPALRPGGAEVCLDVDDGRIRWELREADQVLDVFEVPLADVLDALVMPQEGAGWGIELHYRGEDRVRVWSPRLPLPSQHVARDLVAEVLARAPAAEPGRLPPLAVLR